MLQDLCKENNSVTMAYKEVQGTSPCKQIPLDLYNL